MSSANTNTTPGQAGIESLLLSEADRLLLQQLQTLRWLAEEHTVPAETHTHPEMPEAPSAAPGSGDWSLTGTVDLYDWQRECIDSWFRKGLGTVKVVTGAGKTLLALAIAERLRNERDQDLRVVIVVPTIVLMNQWYDEIRDRSNLLPSMIGRLGGGKTDELAGGIRVLIAVLDSAAAKVPEMVASHGLGEHLFLVVDECHRAGSKKKSRILETSCRWALGLSATPERSFDEEAETDADLDADDELESNARDTYDKSILGQKLGPIVYELTIAKAVELGVLPPFRICHYGLPLSPEEKSRYEKLSRSINDLQADLRANAPRRSSSGNSFFAWVRKAAKGGSPDAMKFIGETSRRQELLVKLQSRRTAVVTLLREEFARRPDARAIVFHESIAAVMQMFVDLRAEGLPVVAEHSRLPPELRDAGLELFRAGIARVMVSARSLIEGFNVPAVDVGVIAASSKSVRQRIQSLGRVLRKHRGANGEEKTSLIHVLYAKETTDEGIYESVDWEKLTGAERNEYYDWDPPQAPAITDGPPRRPKPAEHEIDDTSLALGDPYPGRYEGDEYTCDTMGNIRDSQQQAATNPGEIPQRLYTVKPRGGRFRVTPHTSRVLVIVQLQGTWTPIFLGRLSERFSFGPKIEAASLPTPECWAAAATSGAPYPYTEAQTTLELSFGQKRGGVIKKKVDRGEAYACVGSDARNAASGQAAERLLAILRERTRAGTPVSRFDINDHGHATYREGGRVYFLADVNPGLEFPD